MKLLCMFILSVWAVNANTCLESETEAECMQNKDGCFYLLHQDRCVPSPLTCSERQGMRMCHRALPKHCRWNQTNSECYDFEWTICAPTASSFPGCPSNCSFNWDLAECVQSSRNDTRMAHYYWCGLHDRYPLQWGLVNETVCETQKGAHCSYVPDYRLCMPKQLLARPRVQHFYQAWGAGGDDGPPPDEQDTGYGVFDAMIVLVSFFVLFCVFLLCLDATMATDYGVVAYRQRCRGTS